MDSTEIFALAKAVAVELGEGWSALPPADAVTWPLVELHHADGRRIQFEAGKPVAGRPAVPLVLTGLMPDLDLPDGITPDVPGREGREISVSSGRGAAIIAREIVRRLVPGYGLALHRYAADVAERMADREAKWETIRALAHALEMELPAGRRTEPPRLRWSPADGYGEVWFEVDEGGTVRLSRAYLDRNTAVALAHLLSTIAPTDPDENS
jgi:hypothetical protein